MLVTSNQLTGQESIYKSGYIILISGDTLTGQIKNTSSLAHSEYVLFKNRETGNIMKYYPTQVSGYYFGDSNYYESKSVPFRDASKLRYQQLFLKKLVEGGIELYSLDFKVRESPSPLYKYQSKFYFFRTKSDITLVDLHEENYLLKLKSAFKSNNCVLDNGINYNYNDAGLSNLVLEYGKCLNVINQKVYVEKVRKKLKWGFGVGVTSSDINISDREFQEFISDRGFGYDFNVFVKSNFGKFLAARVGLKYKSRVQNSFSEYTVSEFYDNEGTVFNLESNIKINQILIPGHLLFNQNFGKFNSYVLAGFEVGFNLKNSYYIDEAEFMRVGEEDLIIVNRVLPFEPEDLNTFEYGWVLGFGSAFNLKSENNVYLEMQYTNSSSNNSKDSSSYISQKGFTILVGYNL